MCLTKDEEELLTFYDFPAAHFQHIRTTNPIESSFSIEKKLAMMFKLSRRWKKGGANFEYSKGFRLYWKGIHNSIALEWKILSPNGIMKDKAGFAYSTTFDNNSLRFSFFL